MQFMSKIYTINKNIGQKLNKINNKKKSSKQHSSKTSNVKT